jgi:6,7-dimethyl-8-ribityllumazine synthase
MSTADAPAPQAPKLSGPAPKILIVSAPYYHHVVDGMLAAAREIFVQVHAEVTIVEVSGAYELPQAVAIAVKSGRAFDGYIVLGCVVRGETDHYEFICAAAMDGLMNVAVDNGICLGTAVLTVDTLAQAVARSHETGANKGSEAAVACLKQIALARTLARGDGPREGVHSHDAAVRQTNKSVA